MSIKIKGLDELHRKLDELQHKVEKVGGVHSVPIDELLTPTFLSTQFWPQLLTACRSKAFRRGAALLATQRVPAIRTPLRDLPGASRSPMLLRHQSIVPRIGAKLRFQIYKLHFI